MYLLLVLQQESREGDWILEEGSTELLVVAAEEKTLSRWCQPRGPLSMTTHIPPAHLGLGVLELGLVVLGRSRWWAAQVPLLQVQDLEQGIRAGENISGRWSQLLRFQWQSTFPPLTHYIALHNVKFAQYFCQIQNTQLGFVGLVQSTIHDSKTLIF